jgi:putative tryptophan/tyrosine transport system substrate-binding protein
MSAIGGKRTCLFALHMSAFDPKRTLHGSQPPFQYPSLSRYDLVPSLGVAMRRRDFITLLSSVAVWRPLTAGAQQSAVPVIGLLGSSSSDRSVHMTRALRAGLNDSGFIDGKDFAIEYRWAHDNYDSLPALLADLVKRQVAGIVTIGAEPPALAAKAATNKIPIVFVIDGDPVSIGLVDSINRPGGNVTGMSLMSSTLEAKRLELLSELMPKGTKIAILVNPDYPDTDFQLGSVETAASNIGQEIYVLNARTEGELNTAFMTIVEQRAGALLVAADPFFSRSHNQIIALANRFKVPAIYGSREFVVAGGLISYGASVATAYHGAGIYIGKILKGVKPADLPVQLPTKFELVINLKAAKAIGLEITPTLLARTDEIIE